MAYFRYLMQQSKQQTKLTTSSVPFLEKVQESSYKIGELTVKISRPHTIACLESEIENHSGSRSCQRNF
jgi:hypothetical protein